MTFQIVAPAAIRKSLELGRNEMHSSHQPYFQTSFKLYCPGFLHGGFVPAIRKPEYRVTDGQDIELHASVRPTVGRPTRVERLRKATIMQFCPQFLVLQQRDGRNDDIDVMRCAYRRGGCIRDQQGCRTTTDENKALAQITERLGHPGEEFDIRIPGSHPATARREASSFAARLRSRARPSRMASTSASNS